MDLITSVAHFTDSITFRSNFTIIMIIVTLARPTTVTY